ncbi:MAG: hypothetical protein QOJ50_3571 [Cryptosporangiaceae bacterium]|jgi:hypothetical protein|nr:hypothetical protein [Cryptosporangiaceae bacterium]
MSRALGEAITLPMRVSASDLDREFIRCSQREFLRSPWCRAPGANVRADAHSVALTVSYGK